MDLTDHKDIYSNKGGQFKKFMEKLVMQRKFNENEDLYKKASPFWRVDLVDQLPRIMVVHGTIDTLVPYEDGREFFRQLTKRREKEAQGLELAHVSHTVHSKDQFHNPIDVFVKLPETHHAFNFVVSPRTLALSDAVVAFLTDIYSNSNAPNSKL